jgi:hypothetical protein
VTRSAGAAAPKTKTKTSARGDEDRFSVVTLLGAVGGLCLVFAFLTPLFVIDPARAESEEAAAMLRGYQRQLDELRRQIEGARGGAAGAPPAAMAVAAMVGPAADRVVDFIGSPSPYNLTRVAIDAHELLPMVVSLRPEEAARVATARGFLKGFIGFMALIPLVGMYPAVRGLLRGFRKQGVAGLALTFFTGVVYLGLGAVFILGLPEAALSQLGPAAWLLALGGGLAVVNGIFGVSRRTWWKAYTIYVLAFALLLALADRLAARLPSAL